MSKGTVLCYWWEEAHCQTYSTPGSPDYYSDWFFPVRFFWRRLRYYRNAQQILPESNPVLFEFPLQHLPNLPACPVLWQISWKSTASKGALSQSSAGRQFHRFLHLSEQISENAQSNEERRLFFWFSPKTGSTKSIPLYMIYRQIAWFFSFH